MKKYWLEPDVLEFELEYLAFRETIQNLKYTFNRSNLFNPLYGESRLAPQLDILPYSATYLDLDSD